MRALFSPCTLPPTHRPTWCSPSTRTSELNLPEQNRTKHECTKYERCCAGFHTLPQLHSVSHPLANMTSPSTCSEAPYPPPSLISLPPCLSTLSPEPHHTKCSLLQSSPLPPPTLSLPPSLHSLPPSLSPPSHLNHIIPSVVCSEVSVRRRVVSADSGEAVACLLTGLLIGVVHGCCGS